MTIFRLKAFLPQSQKQLLCAFLFITGGLFHFIGLDHPNSVVFDEVHWGAFSSSYCCTGKYFFDVHPPHAKLIIAGFAKVLGFEAKQTFKNIGEEYSPGEAFAIRFASALVGSLIPVVVFVLSLQLGASRAAAFLGGLLVLFDNALLVQTRIIALDGFLIFFTLTSLSAVLKAMRSESLPMRLWFFALSGVLASLATGSKFTGLVAVGIPGVLGLVDCLNQRSFNNFKRWIWAGFCFLAAGSVVYFAGWYLHFELLTEPGSGDVWGRPTGDFFRDFFHLHQQMFNSNIRLSATHPDASPWWSWPLMMTPIFYWAKGEGWIYLLGNPVLWWGISALFIVALVTQVLSRFNNLGRLPAARPRRRLLWIPFLGYCASYLPFVFVSRILFLYHYFTPLIFSTLFVLLWLDAIGAIRDGDIRKQRLSYYLVIVALLAAFVVISPVTFGVQISVDLRDEIFQVFPGWR